MSTSRRGDVLAALVAADGATVSGEELARRFGVSRVSVAKDVARLRELGYVIDAVPGAGYRLVSSANALCAEDVEARVQSPLVKGVAGGGPTASTNDDARILALAGAPEVTVVVASEQTGGRGRLGRSWESPQGGVYLSFVLRPLLPLAGLTPLPLVVGVGAARGLASLGAQASLKWPNDVLLTVGDRPGGKLAGVLLEMTAESDRAAWVVAGIGVNVREPRPDGRVTGAAYLSDVVADVALSDVAVALIDGITGAYGEFVRSGFGSLAEEYGRRHVLAGRDVVVRSSTGDLLAEGRVSGVDDAGRLVLDTPTGVRAIAAGDVTLRQP